MTSYPKFYCVEVADRIPLTKKYKGVTERGGKFTCGEREIVFDNEIRGCVLDMYAKTNFTERLSSAIKVFLREMLPKSWPQWRHNKSMRHCCRQKSIGRLYLSDLTSDSPPI